MMPTGRNTARTWRMYALAVLAVVILLVLWLPNTPIPNKSKEYIGKAWQSVTGLKEPVDYANYHHEEATKDGVNQMDGAPLNETAFDFDKWAFQYDLEYELPEVPVEKFKNFPAHNYKGPGNPVYATFFTTHSPSLRDPYFMATQQVVYRLLWDPWSRSKKHPVIVFVMPFVTQQQRDLLTAQGALVRELDVVPFHPKESPEGVKGVSGRLINMFSKLEMWKQMDFSLINYMDSDAFPLENIDRIFDIATEQRCNPNLVFEIDLPHGAEMCDYVFAGKTEPNGQVNAGVMVLRPNVVMHDMLIRESKNLSNFDQGLAEQSFVNYIFKKDGAFPFQELEPAWNNFPDVKEAGEPLFIVHSKMWAPNVPWDHWAYHEFEDNWYKMKRFYESYDFIWNRENDARNWNKTVAILNGEEPEE